MADASKLKNRTRKNLGNPPGPEEVATSLNSPEVAPVAVVPDAAEQSVPVPPASSVPETTTPATTQVNNSAPYIRRDGRSARKTYRIIPFATRVTPEFDNEIRDIAEREGIKLVEVLENALIAYKAQKGY
ncbi:TPA: hypothetical protein ACGD9Y_003928 [Salmonella enterica subsp. enterica]|uniref:Uncharacterized protein n=2 Tax=Salmonella enterica TaxID=28901 RepID=A0A5Y5TBC8_SALER|nr:MULTISPECIES: hypothetical protein [Enterobacteriaceae]EAA8756736.1 hypothetical protein [Salmonella enterica subsp. enterica serovar Weltevreden]EAC0964561.1 hypothetical protein [Salmonella enterica subsp. enterica serovar Newport]EBR9008133.1 hypothetical protein [Salmonella enterica subsp. enterica serovar Richmond]EBU7427786.1 hypothetical protein [Salmonella enterica subsp. enterica serovar Lexington]EBU7738905.1 hypothetical protein [Salmonella enterica subsp. enterica serovar Bareil